MPRHAGSGVATTTSFSPLDIGALAEVVVVANWSKVVQLADTAQVIGISIQSNVSIVPTYQVKHQRAADCLTKDRDALLAFYDFPAEHWKHLR